MIHSKFDMINYSDALNNVNVLQRQAKRYDDDTLFEEVSHLQHQIEGKEAEKIMYLEAKYYNDEEFTPDEREFLERVYVIYNCHVFMTSFDGEDCYATVEIVEVEDGD